MIVILDNQNDRLNFARSELKRLNGDIEMKNKEIKELLND